jgi:hypothetical protein
MVPNLHMKLLINDQQYHSVGCEEISVPGVDVYKHFSCVQLFESDLYGI